MPNCKKCQSEQVSKNGFVRNKQRSLCKACDYNFVRVDDRTKPETAVKRAFSVILYFVGKASYRFIAKVFNVAPSTVQKWISSEAERLEGPQISDDVREIEFDEVVGCFSKVLPPDRHKIGKTGTAAVERDNSNMRHHLGRFTRRTKSVSKKVEMVDKAIKFGCALTDPEVYN